MGCERRQSSQEHPQKTKLMTCIVLTLPVVPRDRWFICCVIGPIMLAGCMDIVWSMVGVITAPWWRRREHVSGQGDSIHVGVPQKSHQHINDNSGTLPGSPVSSRSFTTVRWNMGDSGDHTCTSIYNSIYEGRQLVSAVLCSPKHSGKLRSHPPEGEPSTTVRSPEEGTLSWRRSPD